MSLSQDYTSSVSVVITTYNRPDFLYQALRSVVAQTHPVKQIIVVDDCSPTNLIQVLKEFPEQDIVYERLEVNSGPNRARNRGVELATGDWVAFLDDDDAWLPEKLEKQFHAMSTTLNDEQWRGSLCSYRFMETLKDRLWGQTGAVELEVLKSGNPYCGASGLLVERNLISDLKFDEALPCGQDWDIYIRLAKVCSLLYLETPLMLYRRGSHDSVTVKAKKLKIENLEPRLAAIYKHRAWLGDSAFKRRVAIQTLAYVWHKQEPWLWIKESIRLAGVVATFKAIFHKFQTRFSQVLESNNYEPTPQVSNQ